MGFDTELFSRQPVDNNLTCGICKEVLEKPTTVCAEGHMFCAACIADWERERCDCPTCRENIISKILCRPVQNIIMDLQVSCPEIIEYTVSNTKRLCRESDDDVGASKRSLSAKTCDWIGTLSEYLESHKLKECPYRQVHCDLGCNEMLRFCDLESHKEEKCSHRTIKCTLCNEEMKHSDLSLHNWKHCPEKPGRCLFCGEQMLRKFLGKRPPSGVDDLPEGLLSLEPRYSGHYKTCPKMRVLCDFHDHGCNVKVKREDLNKHHIKFARVHARMVNETLKSIQEDKDWSQKEMYWRIPISVLEPALDEPDLMFVEESQRVKIGGYQAFLRLMIDAGVVYVKVCVDRPPFAPSIDSFVIDVEKDSGGELGNDRAIASLSMEDEQKMVKDLGSTCSVGGPLLYSSSTMGERIATAYDLETLSLNGDIVLRAFFRLRDPESVIVDCQRRK